MIEYFLVNLKGRGLDLPAFSAACNVRKISRFEEQTKPAWLIFSAHWRDFAARKKKTKNDNRTQKWNRGRCAIIWRLPLYMNAIKNHKKSIHAGKVFTALHGRFLNYWHNLNAATLAARTRISVMEYKAFHGKTNRPAAQ
jgi:hypothetical protein